MVTSGDGAPGIGCDLGAEGSAAQAARWLRLARSAGLGRVEVPGGLEARFRDAPEVGRELRDLVAVERACCAWASWEVRRDGGALVLRVTSSAVGGAAALHAMFTAR